MDPYSAFTHMIHEIIEEEPLQISCIVGAGLSAGSGLSTFRGKDGLYEDKDPFELASRQGFEANPELVWSWYRDRIANVLKKEPNEGHKALVELEKLELLHIIITQNVDGLHLQAGQSPEKLIEIHGTLSKTHCLNECGRSNTVTEVPDDIPIPCECGSYQRPSVVWFGEAIPIDINDIVGTMADQSNLLLIIGTSGTVMPVARIPYLVANKMRIVNINPDPLTFRDIADISFSENAEIVLPKLLDIIKTIMT